jgi:hypothetical protein
MPNWQTTAKTIFCQAVDDEVTVMVAKDGSVHCTGFKKYTVPNEITRQMIKTKERLSKKSIHCEGESCIRVTEYKHNVTAEEAQ